MKKILVPCDFSKPAINAFRFALDLAALSKGTVYLMNIVELPVLHDTAIMPVLNFEAELLGRKVVFFAKHGRRTRKGLF